MKPRLVLGLGNDLAGDDGVGVRVAERLRSHPRLPADLEVRAGSDLLRWHDAMAGRREVVLVDAVLDPDAARTGTILVLDPADGRLPDAGGSVHHLSPTAAVRLLRAVDPAIRAVPITLWGIVIGSAEVGDALSPELDRALDAITEQLLAALGVGGSGRRTARGTDDTAPAALSIPPPRVLQTIAALASIRAMG